MLTGDSRNGTNAGLIQRKISDFLIFYSHHSRLSPSIKILASRSQGSYRSAMSPTQQSKANSLLSPQFINGVYIPSGLLLLGVGIIKFEWLPFAIAVSLVLGAWKIYSAG